MRPSGRRQLAFTLMKWDRVSHPCKQRVGLDHSKLNFKLLGGETKSTIEMFSEGPWPSGAIIPRSVQDASL